VRIATGWRARVGVPWKGLGVPEPKDGEVWGLNLRRIDQTGSFSLKTMADGAWMPQSTDPQDALNSGHLAFVLQETLADDAKLAAMRQNLADGHALAIRAWAGPNDGDALLLGAAPVTLPNLGRIASGAPARQATKATIARDDNGLIVSFDCEDADLCAAQEGRDNPKIWKDDSVYVWLDPAHDHTGMIMVQVTASGVVNDSRNGDAKWNLEGLVAETKRTETGWTAHLVLPFAGLGVESPATLARPAHSSLSPLWGFNLCRMDQPVAYDYYRMQMTSFALIPGGDAGARHRWGHLAFGKVVDPAASAVHAALKKTVDARLVAEAAAAKAEQERLAVFRGLPANLKASEDVHKIVKWLTELPDRKENRFLLGNDIWCYDTIDGKTGMDAGYLRFAASIHKKTGKWLPMIHVSYGDPSNPEQKPSVAEQANAQAIAYWKAGGLVHIHVNPNSPLNGAAMGPKSLEGRERIAEVLQPGTEANKRWLQTLDAWAKQLAELRDNGVVVLWRPLHEMGFEGCYWYDWGAVKSGEVYKKIWQHMFKYYSEEKKLDNLVWVWGGGGPHSLEMYPGAEYVDMVGFSQYGSDVIRFDNEYEHMLRYGKPISFTEFGPAGTEEPAFDNLALIRAVREQYPMMVSATYWHSWTGVRTAIADCRNVEALMNDPLVIDRDELDWRAVTARRVSRTDDAWRR
jgi:mannan endo-1,4-beta-mannosidase